MNKVKEEQYSYLSFKLRLKLLKLLLLIFLPIITSFWISIDSEIRTAKIKEK
ncbi:hypothetical protein [Poseidonibacter ostreae]|uniref:hypothetical protein n=1 Tax=Poseidonibacter ostreae TaxID=2654171 RepID=UPI00186AEC01|nr:hypothetical protein [Poseidonibacter ostreae]